MTTKEVCEKFGISRARLHVWRMGSRQMHKETEYAYGAKLIEGEDWYIKRLKIHYTDAGIEKIKSLLRKDGE